MPYDQIRRRLRQLLPYLLTALVLILVLGLFTPVVVCEYYENGDAKNCIISSSTHRIFYIVGRFLVDNAVVINALSTIVIAFFTVTIWRATEGMFQVTETALVSLERPWIFVENFTVENKMGMKSPNNWYLEPCIRNIGRSPAIVKRFEVKIEPKESLPEVPDYTGANILPCKRSFASQESAPVRKIGPSTPFDANGNPINYVYYGRIIYAELSGKIHHTGFAIEVSPDMPVGDTYNNDAYHYYD